MKNKTAKLTFGQVFRDARIKAGVSVTTVAVSIGKTQSYVSQIESGAIHPPNDPERIQRLAEAIECEDPEHLFFSAGLVPPKLQSELFNLYTCDPAGTQKAISELSAAGSTNVRLKVNVDQGAISKPFDDKSQPPKNGGAKNV